MTDNGLTTRHGEAPCRSRDGEVSAPIGPPEIDLGHLPKMTKAALADLAELLGLPRDGRKADLIKRIRAKKLGGDRRHVHGGTLCPRCSHVVMVTHVEPGKYRRIKCPHCGYREKMAW